MVLPTKQLDCNYHQLQQYRLSDLVFHSIHNPSLLIGLWQCRFCFRKHAPTGHFCVRKLLFNKSELKKQYKDHFSIINVSTFNICRFSGIKIWWNIWCTDKDDGLKLNYPVDPINLKKYVSVVIRICPDLFFLYSYLSI